jgi:hypothetical protein
MRAASLALVLVPATAACGAGKAPPTCLDYSETSYEGSYSLVAVMGAMKTGLGAAESVVVVDDFDPFVGSCPSGQSFLVHVGASCDLHATSTAVRHDTGRGASGAFLGATADIVSDANYKCSVQTADGPLGIAVASGTLTFQPNAISLTFGGTTLSSTGVVGQYATFHIDGSLR